MTIFIKNNMRHAIPFFFLFCLACSSSNQVSEEAKIESDTISRDPKEAFAAQIEKESTSSEGEVSDNLTSQNQDSVTQSYLNTIFIPDTVKIVFGIRSQKEEMEAMDPEAVSDMSYYLYEAQELLKSKEIPFLETEVDTIVFNQGKDAYIQSNSQSIFMVIYNYGEGNIKEGYSVDFVTPEADSIFYKLGY